jgi:hypothetical protein
LAIADYDGALQLDRKNQNYSLDAALLNAGWATMLAAMPISLLQKN